MAFEASCPSCSAPIEFNVANSLVTVCGSCGSAVGRGDGKLEDYGKVADLTQTDSPLQVGLTGDVKGVPYEITGRTQLRHSTGAVWDEWYVAFKDGERWGWLAEAQGKYYLTFRKELPARMQLPPIADLQLESQITVPQVGKLTVVEVGEAELISAEGEIPFEFRPGERTVYADLVGPGKKFATLDGSQDPPVLYLGGEFPLERLGIAGAASREEENPTAGAVTVACPSCGGSLEVRAPDETMRVSCSYCGALHAADQGSLRFLEALDKPKVKPVIPLGGEGELRGRKYMVIGFMQRVVRYQGRGYYWTEYLLYTPRQPFHWLICNNHHWSLGKPLSAAEVAASFREAKYDGQTFKLFDRSTPEVTCVLGEFYWPVRAGERVGSADFIAPPRMLSREETLAAPAATRRGTETTSGGLPNVQTGAAASAAETAVASLPSVRATTSGNPDLASKEINYTVSEYIPREEVELAFGVKGLRTGTGIAPNQPYPYRSIYSAAFMLVAAALFLIMFTFAFASRDKVFTRSFPLAATTESSRVFFTEPFELKGHKNIRVKLHAPVNNSWVWVTGDFFNEETGVVQPFSSSIEYYHGVSGGESWSEGSRNKSVYASSVPEGSYTMRLETQWDKMRYQGGAVTVTVEQGVPRILNVILLLLVLLVPPILIGIHHYTFEMSRWSESDYSPYASE